MPQTVFILDRATVDSADDLLAVYGESAEHEAACRAMHSRDQGNIHHFCRWRQIERIVNVLADYAVSGTVH